MSPLIILLFEIFHFYVQIRSEYNFNVHQCALVQPNLLLLTLKD